MTSIALLTILDHRILTGSNSKKNACSLLMVLLSVGFVSSAIWWKFHKPKQDISKEWIIVEEFAKNSAEVVRMVGDLKKGGGNYL